jgi:hypothetical protein
MERIKLLPKTGSFIDVKCSEYGCSLNCPLFVIIGGYPTDSCQIIETEIAAYTACAVALVWAEFYGLY